MGKAAARVRIVLWSGLHQCSSLFWDLFDSVRKRSTFFSASCSVQVGSAWAIAYFISTWQAHFLHRWLTFESPAGYTKSLVVMLLIYTVFLVISTASHSYFSCTLGYYHLYSWAANTALFGFLMFLCLRIFAFPLSDGRITREERLEQYRERRRA